MNEATTFFLAHLTDIERIVVTVGRRAKMTDDQIEEFSADVKLRLMENDYRLLREFRGTSSLTTYIAAVVRRMLLEHRSREWGKWRDSAEAQRLGPMAVELERLVQRDGRTRQEALTLLLEKYPDVTARMIDALADRFPARIRRRFVDIEDANSTLTPSDIPDTERVHIGEKVSKVIKDCLERLPQEDRRLLRLRFGAGMTVAQIARAMSTQQPVLYRRLYKVLDELRVVLQKSGIRATEIKDLIGRDPAYFKFQLATTDEKAIDEEDFGDSSVDKPLGRDD